MIVLQFNTAVAGCEDLHASVGCGDFDGLYPAVGLKIIFCVQYKISQRKHLLYVMVRILPF